MLKRPTKLKITIAQKVIHFDLVGEGELQVPGRGHGRVGFRGRRNHQRRRVRRSGRTGA